MRELPKAEQERRTAFAGRIFSSGLQLLELSTMHLGNRLGYYAALQQHRVPQDGSLPLEHDFFRFYRLVA